MLGRDLTLLPAGPHLVLQATTDTLSPLPVARWEVPTKERKWCFSQFKRNPLDFGLEFLYEAFILEVTHSWHLCQHCFAQVVQTMHLEQKREATSTKWAAIDFHMFIGIREEKDLLNHLVSIITAELLPTGHLLVVCQLQFRKLSCSVQYNGS